MKPHFERLPGGISLEHFRFGLSPTSALGWFSLRFQRARNATTSIETALETWRTRHLPL